MNLIFFNHASIGITDNSSKSGIITDPWISSKAFGGWEAFPQPNVAELERCVDMLEDYALVISHGHDDHCDDLYIQSKLEPSFIFIPKLSSPGFLYRIKRICSQDTNIVELEHGKPYRYKGFELISTINPDFTNNDAIIAIKDNANTVVHANDNWHEQPDHILNVLKLFSVGTDITYLAQVGIAGSFPLFYLDLTDSEKKSLIDRQLRLQAYSLERNACSIGAVRAYSYANESRFTYLDSSHLYSREIRNTILSSCITRETVYKGELANTQDFKFESLVYHNTRQKNSLIHQEMSEERNDILEVTFSAAFSSELSLLNEKINEYLDKSGIEGLVMLSAISYQELNTLFDSGQTFIENHESPTLYIFSTYDIWRQIVSGILTLESITIGGCGLLKKSDSSWNARFVHDALSRFGYRYQAMIKAKTTHL